MRPNTIHVTAARTHVLDGEACQWRLSVDLDDGGTATVFQDDIAADGSVWNRTPMVSFGTAAEAIAWADSEDGR